MVRLPRDLSGHDVARALRVMGYTITRQTGSHLRLTTQQHGEHHITIPAHPQLRVGTLAAILGEVARHAGLDRDALTRQLFG